MWKTVYGMVVALLLACGCVVFGAGQMIMVKGEPARTGYVDEAVQLPLSLMWQYTTPPYANNPSVPLVTHLKEAEDNVVFFTVENEVFAVKASTGELAWQKQYELISGNASGPATLAGDHLLINCSDGNLYSVNIHTGALVWRSPKHSSTHAAPTVLDGKIYSGTTGSGLWISSLADGSSQANDVIPTNGQVYSSPAYAAPYLFFTDSAGYIYRYDLTRPLARDNPVKTPGLSTSLYSTPVVWKDMLFLGNGTGKSVLALSTSRMDIRWSVPLTGGVYASPSVTPDGRIYVGTTDGKVYCLDATNRGRILWEKRLEAVATPDVRAAATVTSNGIVFVGTLRGTLYALDAKTGTILWKYRLPTDNVRPAAIRTPLTIVDGKAFLVTDDGSLYCFAGDAFDAEPPAVKKVRLEVKAEDKKAYAYPFAEFKLPNASISDGDDEEEEEPMIIPGLPPLRATMTLTDIGSGLDESSIIAQVNGTPMQVEYKSDTATLTVTIYDPKGAASQRALPAGEYRLIVTAKDWRGNTLKDTRVFYVDPSTRPPAPPAGATQGQGFPGGGSGGGGIPGMPGTGGGGSGRRDGYS